MLSRQFNHDNPISRLCLFCGQIVWIWYCSRLEEKFYCKVLSGSKMLLTKMLLNGLSQVHMHYRAFLPCQLCPPCYAGEHRNFPLSM